MPARAVPRLRGRCRVLHPDRCPSYAESPFSLSINDGMRFSSSCIFFASPGMDRPFAPWEKASVIYSSLDSLLWAHHVATAISKKGKGVIVGEDFLGV